MNAKIVMFKNGKYAIRYGYWFTGYTFLDLLNTNHKWRIGSQFFKDCLGTEDEIIKKMGTLDFSYEIIKKNLKDFKGA